MRYHGSVLLGCVLLAMSAAAQQSRCEFPMNAIKAGGEPISGLTASDFGGQLKKQSLAIESVAYQAQPRRVLLVIDTLRKLSPDVRLLEIEFATAVVKSAQTGDSFGLLTTAGLEVKFGADRTALLQAIGGLEAGDSSHAQKSAGTLDRIAEGAGWFQQPQLGDSIIVLTADLGDRNKANPAGVAKLLAVRHIRLFGVSVGRLQVGNPSTGVMGTGPHGLSYEQPGIPMYGGDYGDVSFLPLAVNSGGYVVPEGGSARADFKLTDLKRQQLQMTGALMTKLIDEVYDVRLKAPAVSREETLTMNLEKEKVASSPGAHLLYPHQLGPCQ